MKKACSCWVDGSTACRGLRCSRRRRFLRKAERYPQPVEISLTASEPGAEIRYTLDGSVPGKSDMRYEKAIRLTGPAVLRARAFKEGFTRSITAQEVFIIAN